MATISDCRAVFGLSAVASPAGANASGTVSVGYGPTQVRITAANVIWSAQALLVDTPTDLVLALATGSKAGSTAWTAGAPQVETATITAAGGCTSNGTMALVLTSAAVVGTPLTVNVALTTTAHTSAALIAQAAVDALNAVTAVTDKFVVTRSTANIILTRRAASTYTVASDSVPVYGSNDGTLNLAIPGGLGVTAAASSANTTAGTASSGCYLVASTGIDFTTTGTAIASGSLGGFVIRNEDDSSSGITVTTTSTMTDFPIPVAGELLLAAPNCDATLETITIEPITTARVSVVAVGSST